MLTIITCVYCPPIFLFWGNVLFRASALLIGLFLLLLLSCLSCLYILEIKPLLVASFANIFSESIGESIGFFILFMAFLAVQKLVSQIKSHLFIFALISIALED